MKKGILKKVFNENNAIYWIVNVPIFVIVGGFIIFMVIKGGIVK